MEPKKKNSKYFEGLKINEQSCFKWIEEKINE